MKRLLDQFRPAWWLPGGHAQTLSAAYWKGTLLPERGVPRAIELPDGDQLVAMDDRPMGWVTGHPAVLMMHGLGGCARNPLLVRVTGLLVQRGIRVFRLNLRSCGAGSGQARLPYHAGRSDDLHAAVEAVNRWCRDDNSLPESPSPLMLFGMSLSGNLLLKYLGENPQRVPAVVRWALAVNPPIDLARSVRTLEQRWNRGYDRHFTGTLIEHIRKQGTLRPDFAPLPNPLPQSLYDFDDRYTAPHGGYANAADYYSAASACPHLSRIQTPTYLLTAADDPLVPVEMIREQSSRMSPAIQLTIASGGGHLGYVGRQAGDPSCRWLDWRIVELAERLWGTFPMS